MNATIYHAIPLYVRGTTPLIVRKVGLWIMLLAALAWIPPLAAQDTGSYVRESVFGDELYIVEAGNKDAPTVVLVHGVGAQASDIWRPLMPVLAQHFHVLTFDLPGFGRSGKGNRLYSPENYVAVIRELTQKRAGGKPFKLVGHSMGGNIALHYAASHPEDVERLMLVDVAGILHRISYSGLMAQAGIEALPEQFGNQQQNLRALAGALLGTVMRNNELLEMAEWMVLTEPQWRERILRGDPQTIAAYAMMMTDYSDLIPSVETPTLLVWGERDTVAPMRTAKVLAGGMPNAGLVRFEASGHVPMTDEPQRFEGLLVDYLRAAPAQRDGLIAQHRYRLADASAAVVTRTAACRDTTGMVIEGDYARIDISGCRAVVVRGVRARELRIHDSQVMLENAVISGGATALHVEDSRVQVTATRLQGETALAFRRSEIDLAGVHLIGERVAVRRLSGAAVEPVRADPGESILFSVSQLTTQGKSRWMHGPVRLTEQEGL